MSWLGRRIAGARIEAGLTQAQLGEAAGGVSQAAVQKWESGKVQPSVIKLRAIAEVTGKPFTYFIEGTAEGSETPETESTTVTVGGIPVTGPAAKIADILNNLQKQKAEEKAEEEEIAAIAGDRRPNPRHTGVHAFIDRLEEAKASGSRDVTITDARGARVILTISPEEELALRTVGFSGPPVTTERQVVDLILLWRDWALNDEEKHRIRMQRMK